MFTVVIVPIGVQQKKFSNISFLGPILDKGHLRSGFKDSELYTPLRQQRANDIFLSAEERLVQKKTPAADINKDYLLTDRPYKRSIDEIIETEKDMPVFDKKPDLKPMDEYSEIEGGAKERAVIFKPPISGDMELVPVSDRGEAGVYQKIKLKVLIAADGSVERVENLQTSGNPEIDLMAIRYVKKWKFAPLNPDREQVSQEGILQLELREK